MDELQLCNCKIENDGTRSNSKSITLTETFVLEDEKIVWERDFRYKYLECLNCLKPKKIISKYLLRDRVYWKNSSKDIIIHLNNTRNLLNLFKKQETITIRKVINFLPGNYLTILTELWKKGIIKIHRKKDVPKIFIPSEYANEIPEWVYSSVTREGFSLKSISLTNYGRKLLESQLKWEKENVTIQKAKIIYEDFFNNYKKPVTDDERLIFLYDILKYNYTKVLRGKVNIIYNTEGDELVRFNPNFDFFVLTLRVLVEIYKTISDSKLIYPPYLAEKLKLSKKDLRYIRAQLEKVLEIQPVYFNFPRSDLPSESNPLTIPIEVQNVLTDFEIHLRDFLIDKLLSNKRNDKSSFFPQKMLKRLKKDVIREMKESGKSQSFIQQFKSSNLSNRKDLIWIFEQMSCSQYISFINYNSGLFGKYFNKLDYENDLSIYYGKLRNIKAHTKTQAERDISKHLGILYRYEKVFIN